MTHTNRKSLSKNKKQMKPNSMTRTQKKKVFSKENYNSSDGMLTNVWGPAMWHYLHTMSFNYPVNPTNKDKLRYKQFIKQLKYVLPCKYCRINLCNNFKTNPLTNFDMKNRETFSKYIYNLHELINKMLGKKSNLSYETVRDTYENFRARCNIDKSDKLFDFEKKEKGCLEPLYGKKSKCVINIVPQCKKCKTMKIDKACFKKRLKKQSKRSTTKRRKAV